MAVKTGWPFNCGGCEREFQVEPVPGDECERVGRLLRAVFSPKPGRLRIRGRWVVVAN